MPLFTSVVTGLLVLEIKQHNGIWQVDIVFDI